MCPRASWEQGGLPDTLQRFTTAVEAYNGAMLTNSSERLCVLAADALNPQDMGGFFVGDVACALEDERGVVWTGTCVGGDTLECAPSRAPSARW